ncbi:MAG: hypothetical protein WCV93_01265 [Candidatus Shapirobacteria bacterium]|jgi:tetratricopeptide (TPR) repeat protein
MYLTPDQITKLSSLGLSQPSKIYHPRSKNSVLPLLSISGLSIISFGSLVLLKSNQNPSSKIQDLPSKIQIIPTQVPKSIQHYLLASQTYFSQALALQQQKPTSTINDRPSTIDLLNQSILSATDAIKLFPQDFRGYEQRARIYQSLSDSQPQFIDSALADFSIANRLNPSSAEISRLLASLYAKKGDAQNTLQYLMATVSLEPTKAQNFYDLARLQQQIGQIPEALATYTRLLPLLTDQSQIQVVSSEKSALENLLSQNKNNNPTSFPSRIQDPGSTISPEGPLLEASIPNGPIIASPETDKKISVVNQSDSNALSGNSTLPANQKQLTITNSHVSSLSQIYLTTTKGGKNQNLQIFSKQPGSFIVGLDSPVTEDIEFKWWIIN